MILDLCWPSGYRPVKPSDCLMMGAKYSRNPYDLHIQKEKVSRTLSKQNYYRNCLLVPSSHSSIAVFLWMQVLLFDGSEFLLARRSSYRRLSSMMLTLQRNNSSNCPRVFGEDSRAFCWIPLSEWCVASSNINLHTGTAQWLEQKQFTQQNHH